jgi:hypothetical protein
MHLRGVPIAVFSKWLGHASAKFTMGVYVHSQDDALTAAGETLAGAYVARSVEFRETLSRSGATSQA